MHYAFCASKDIPELLYDTPLKALDKGTGTLLYLRGTYGDRWIELKDKLRFFDDEFAPDVIMEQDESYFGKLKEQGYIYYIACLIRWYILKVYPDDTTRTLQYGLDERIKTARTNLRNEINRRLIDMIPDDKPEPTAIALPDTPATSRGIQIQSYEDLWRFANMVKGTDFVPAAFKNAPPATICVAIQYGMELGLTPMQSLQSIAVINDKPSIYGDGLIALCMAHPDCESIDETFDDASMTAACTVKRRNHAPYTMQFSKADADQAGLTKKQGPWREYPKRMLQMRARGFALRDKFADALKGIITVEEARDYPSEPVKATVTAVATVKQEPRSPSNRTPPATAVSEREIEQRSYDQFRFGRNKGCALDDPEVADSDLQWYYDAVSNSVNDPDRAQYKQANTDHLQQIAKEIARREQFMDAKQEHSFDAVDEINVISNVEDVY